MTYHNVIFYCLIPSLSNLFPRARETLKTWEWPGDEANFLCILSPGEPTPPPTPPPVKPRWVELVAPFSLCEEEPVELAGSLSGETENDAPASEEKPGSDGGSVHMQECRKGKELKRVWMEYLDFIKAFQ